MATPYHNRESSFFTLRPDEAERLEKRRKAAREYEPPKWRSNHADLVSGQFVEVPMVEHASILAREIEISHGISAILPVCPITLFSCTWAQTACSHASVQYATCVRFIFYT